MISSFMIIQIISGVILSFLYVADVSLRFGCVVDLTAERLFL